MCTTVGDSTVGDKAAKVSCGMLPEHNKVHLLLSKVQHHFMPYQPLQNTLPPPPPPPVKGD